MPFAQILSTGRYVPERVVTNAELEQALGEPVHDWLIENVGIRERRFMADDQVTSDLCVAAARTALARAATRPEALDLIIVATDTPDYVSPATAAVVQAKLGAPNAGVFDLNTACAGWVTGLDVAARYIATDPAYRRILLVGAYGMSRFLDLKDKKTATLFADGAGAVVLGAGDRPGFIASKLLAVGEYHDALGVYTGGTARPATAGNVAAWGAPRVEFVRKFPKTFNSDRWPVLVRDVLEKAAQAGLAREGQPLTPGDVDWYFFTQLNLRTIEMTMAALKQPLTKTHWIMDKWGYTGSACIPMALDDALAQGTGPKAGDLVIFCASGGGLAMAASLWRWTVDRGQWTVVGE
jgi:3-oxoacyl-[acyl-carrier-protein] synthase-3